MSLLDLFRPAWKNSDKKKREAAIRSINDEKILKRVVEEDPSEEIRFLAHDLLIFKRLSSIRDSDLRLVSDFKNREFLLDLLKGQSYGNKLKSEALVQFEKFDQNSIQKILRLITGIKDATLVEHMLNRIRNYERKGLLPQDSNKLKMILLALIYQSKELTEKYPPEINDKIIEKIGDQPFIERMIRDKQLNDSFRLNAIGGISSKNILRGLMNDLDDVRFQRALEMRIKIVEVDSVAREKDQAKLKEIINDKSKSHLHSTAIKNIEDQEFLFEMVMKNATDEVFLNETVEKITDPLTLIRIVRSPVHDWGKVVALVQLKDVDPPKDPEFLAHIRTPLFSLMQSESSFRQGVMMKAFKKWTGLLENVDITDDEGNSLLLIACGDNYIRPEIVKLLLDYGADPNFTKSSDGIFPLYIAALNAQVEKIKLLLDKGADINQKANREAATSLMASIYNLKYSSWRGFAQRSDFAVTAKVLMEAGIDKHATNSKGESVYYMIAKEFENNEEVKRLALEIVGKPEKEEKIKYSPQLDAALFSALKSKDVEKVDEAIKAGANVNTLFEDQSLLYIIRSTLRSLYIRLLTVRNDESRAKSTIEEIHEVYNFVDLLIDGGADVNMHIDFSFSKGTILSIWIGDMYSDGIFDDTEFIFVEKLLKAGANPNVPGKYSTTILHYMLDKLDKPISSRLLRMFVKSGLDFSVLSDEEMEIVKNHKEVSDLLN